ncbi:MAG: hypothetical protein ACI4U5_06155 [Bacilli bacterium]
MHSVNKLPVCEKLAKKIVLKQMGPLKGKRILDFGSGIASFLRFMLLLMK